MCCIFLVFLEALVLVTTLALERHGVAVCLTGHVRRAWPPVLASVREHLLGALASDNQVDLFLVTAGKEDVEELLGAEWRLASVHAETRSLRQVLVDHGPPCESDNELVRIHKAITGREACEIYRAHVGGNAFCGGGLWQLFMHDICKRLVKAEEVARQPRPAEYEWVVWSRFDSRWTYPHLPLRFLSRGVWVSSEEQHGGSNDRHIVASRDFMDAVFSGWKYFSSGLAAAMVSGNPAAGDSLQLRQMNQEAFFGWRLEVNDVKTNLIPTTFYLVCSRDAVWPTSRLGPGSGDPSAPDGMAVCFPEAVANRANMTCVQHGHRGGLQHVRYLKEFETALQISECVALHGGWSPEAVVSCWCDGTNLWHQTALCV